MKDIEFYNRYSDQMETEQVYGEAFLKWAYGNPLGKLALHSLIKRAAFSRWYGKRMDSPSSRSKIEPFISDYDLDISEFADHPESFASFNEFFYRKLKHNTRPIAKDTLVFPADGRHLAFPNIDNIDGFFVKGQTFNLAELIKDKELHEKYSGGSLILSRLCPVDYHRFHFPVSGHATSTRVVNGPLFSVSPIALTRDLSYLWQNKRTMTLIETTSMGTVLMMEIGATCVGSIHQTYAPDQTVEKGEEKGYFAFGGSSTIVIFEPGSVQFSEDILENSAKCIETYAHMGDSMGQAKQ